ncbi:DUF4913 domain-containing protein [Streptomyces sp. NPDC048581]|uniref:DUF4913 domain-containing protein n=1 Tax=unclassified Streptomyces TaxID=2593676 RepID=UPI00371DAC3A
MCSTSPRAQAYTEALRELTGWTHHVLLPVYGRETTSNALWCSRWWLHQEAVMSLHGLFLAWQELTSAEAGLTGPASWHRDFLGPVMDSLRAPSGPFAGCKPGRHRDKEQPPVEVIDPFGLEPAAKES